MAICPDTSALLPFLLPDQPTAKSQPPSIKEFWFETLRSGEPLVAPPLLFAEITSVLRRYVYDGKLVYQEAATALDDLFHMSIVTIHQPAIYLQALDFAHRLGHAKAYDVQFLAVAQMQNCTVVTLDRGLYQGACTLGLEARMLL